AHDRSRRDDTRTAPAGARRSHSPARDSPDRRVARKRLLVPRRPMSSPLNGTVMWLTWRQLFARRRLWLATAFSLAPVPFTLVFRVLADDGPSSETTFFGTLMREIVMGTLLPLAALVFGTTAFGGEVDDGTLLYLLVKPIQRWQVLTSKFVVAVLSTIAVVLP